MNNSKGLRISKGANLQNDRTRSRDLQRRILSGISGKYRFIPVLIAIALVWAFFYAMNDRFLSPRNLTNLAVQIVVTAMLALGLVLVLIVKEIDLSVAALSAVASGVMGYLLVTVGLPSWLCLLAAIVTGSAVGLVQGLIISRFRAPAFIVTLGTSLAMQGVLLMLLPRSGSIPLSGTDIQWIANSFLPPMAGYLLLAIGIGVVAALLVQSSNHKRRLGIHQSIPSNVLLPIAALSLAGGLVVAILNLDRGVPTPVAILIVLLSIMAYVTTQTKFGTYLYAIGGNVEASRRAAINVGRIRIYTFIIAGALAGIAGIISASRTLGVSAQSGSGTLLLEAVAAAVIGGASLFGGRGSVWAALLGALLIGSITNGLSLLSAPTEIKYLVQGLILVLAVTADGLLSRDAKT
ncbi:ABC transporter permease [Mesorhizobium sp. 113-3-9]|uniref:sugar ABC transporter permease n=1 Tax=Mesorhizobium sp. 113-3-9 TaxID=2744517 RepID=UPI0019266C70|nr:ABC transporter permease [Mesorhizobium sp. 113-3-9]BCG90387.1 ABC transporter permease [Mesorhizobium sp. 113-3-9]